MKIGYYGVDLEVTYEYYEEEPTVMYYKDMSGHPGSPAEVELFSAEVNGVDIIEILNEEQIEEIENIILNKL